MPIPNTNIASNVGPQFNPKDVSYLQAETGSYAAEYGDRTYGVFNVAPNTGFERNRQAELIASYGNYNQTDDWLSFGDHTSKFAYYVSASGNSTNWGLEPPTSVNLHNQAAGRRRIHFADLQSAIPRTSFASTPGSDSTTTRCPTIPTCRPPASTIASASRTSSPPAPGSTPIRPDSC